MAFDDENYSPTTDEGDRSYDAWDGWADSDGSSADPVDQDSDVVTEPDDRSDVPDASDWNDWDEGSLTTSIDKAERVLDLAGPALKVLGEVVKAAGNPQAAAALQTLSITTKIAGGFTEYVGKQVKRRREYDDVPVKVPTNGRRRSTSDDVLAALARDDD